MPFILNTEQDQRDMLESIGASSIEELFDSIPADIRFQGALDLPASHDELALTQRMMGLAEQNCHAGSHACFLGGGSYDHFIPAVVDHLASRGEFYTSYTPYQPEVSQGNLQAMFEYQTLICQLTGMDVSNASLYDGGSATVEAVLMCLAASKKSKRVVMLRTLHPEYRSIIDTYLENLDVDVVTVQDRNGTTDLELLEQEIADGAACVVVQHPNFFGNLEQMAEIVRMSKEAGAMVVQAFDPISLGVLKNPGELGVDVAVAEGQSLGNPMQFGGPYLGILACREEFVRRMPGRIAGQTVSGTDKRCWVLTLQTREQHIRREKATSNICTNQGLFALRASIYLSLLGPQGLREVAERCTRHAHYAMQQITQKASGSAGNSDAPTLPSDSRVTPAFDAPFFKEFVVRDRDNQVGEWVSRARDNQLLAGIPLRQWYPELEDCLLVAVTEKRTVQQIDQLVGVLANSEGVESTLNS